MAHTEPYFYNLQWAIARIMRHIPDVQSPYFIDDHLDIPPEKERVGYIVVTADKGLAGSYNHNVIKLVEQRLQRPGEKTFFIVGELGRQYFNHAGINTRSSVHYTVQNPTLGPYPHHCGTGHGILHSGQIGPGVYHLHQND